MTGSINKFDFIENQRWPLLIKNESGHTLPAFGCAVVTGLDVSAVDGETVLTVERPTSDTAENAMLVFNSRFAIANGGTGRATTGPFLLAGYSGADPAVGDRFDKTTDSFLLTASSGGPLVCWGVIDATNNVAAFFYQPERNTSAGSELIFIKAPSGGIPPRASNLLGSAVCDKYVINNTGQLEDSTEDVTVVNWATTAVCSNGLRYGIAAYIDSNWVVISEDCADESGPVQPQAGQYTSGTILSSFPDVESTILPDFGSFTSGSHTRSSNITGGFE